MNKSREQIKLMLLNAEATARDEHGINISLEHLEHIACELLAENTDKFLRSVFGTFSLNDTLNLISVIEERKLEALKKAVQPEPKPKSQPRVKSKSEAH